MFILQLCKLHAIVVSFSKYVNKQCANINYLCFMPNKCVFSASFVEFFCVKYYKWMFNVAELLIN